MGSMLNGPDLLNMLGGSHYTQNEASESIAAGTELSKVYGPFFYYNNKCSGGDCQCRHRAVCRRHCPGQGRAGRVALLRGS